MAEIAEALERFVQLATIASRATTGNPTISHADFDEMRVLMNVTEDRLPEAVIEILIKGFPSAGSEQQTFGERILRNIEVAKKYGVQVSASSSETMMPTFTLSKDDKQRVLKLCADMRKIVFASPHFDDPHKRRLLNRIAAIESQVHAKKGMFDVILGGVADVGETLGKFGKDIKPLTDRMNEVARITRQNTGEYDQIPAPDEIKSLPAPDESTDASADG